METGDQVNFNVTSTFDTANAGTGKTLTFKFTLSGRDAAKYSAPINRVINSMVITKKQLTADAPNITKIKTYDGTTSATVAVGTLNGVVGTDDVVLHATGTYNDKEIANSKTITVSYSLSGAQSSNYTAPVAISVSDGAITPNAR